MIVSSNEYLVWVDGTAVPDVQTVALSYTLSTLEATTKPTGGYKESVADTRTVTVTFDAILDTINLNRFNLGDNIALRFGTIDTSFNADGGIIKDITQNGATDGVPNYSVTIETTGDVTTFTALTLVELCDNNGNTICTDAGEPICVNFNVQLVLRELCDNNGNIICDGNGEAICLTVLNIIN